MKEKDGFRIRAIEVNNFKSLVGFQLVLAKFSCLIGLNGVGKSTVLQFIDFLSQLVRGNLKAWLEERQWKPNEVKSKLTTKKNIEFCVHFVDRKGAPAGRWMAHYNPSESRCTWERIDLLDFILETVKNEVRVTKVKETTSNNTDWKSTIMFGYEGSILSALRDELLPPSILNCKKFFQGIESLEMLTPDRLRQRTREAHGSLGYGGRHLSAFVYELGPRGRKDLAKRMKQAYVRLDDVYAKPLRSGWKQLLVAEVFDGIKMWTEARHVNDGMLRVIAILAELASNNEFLLFDEIENGINPELVEFVTDALVGASQQVVVTTHSPMILNYLNDDTAQQGVIYFYKTTKGYTKSVPFFSIPSLKKKLTVMGPGEAFVDTNLSELDAEIAGTTTEEA